MPPVDELELLDDEEDEEELLLEELDELLLEELLLDELELDDDEDEAPDEPAPPPQADKLARMTAVATRFVMVFFIVEFTCLVNQ